jgi:hypothetical protein
MVANQQVNPNQTARMAGTLYLLLFPLSMLAFLFIPAFIVVPGDVTATVNNIMTNELLFRLSIVSGLMVKIINIWLVFVLYRLFKPVNKHHALIMVIFLLLAVPIIMLNELNKYAVLLILSNADYLAIFSTENLHALVPFFLNLYDHGLIISQIFWGLWLFPMGLLIINAGFLPKILGYLMLIACLGYLADAFTAFVFPNFGFQFTGVTALGELLLTLWLLIKGVNVEKWHDCASRLS